MTSIEAVLATHRLVRLVNADGLTRGPRRVIIADAYGYADGLTEAQQEIADGIDDFDPTVEDVRTQPWEELVEADPTPPKLAYLVLCPWCVGMYASAVVVALERWQPPGWRTLRRVLALSSMVGLIAGHETP